jgi:hypothetical protein
MPDSDNLRVGMTGVSRHFRRKGLALSRNLRAIAYARAHGHMAIETMNAADNAAIIALNERLGFANQYALLEFQKDSPR